MKKILLVAFVLLLAVVSAWAITIGGKPGYRSGSGPSIGGEVGMSIPQNNVVIGDGEAVTFNTDTVVTFNGDSTVTW